MPRRKARKGDAGSRAGAALTLLGFAAVFGILTSVLAVVPNPGHPWTQIECDSLLCVLASGVGIGTTSPGAKLDVRGEARIEGGGLRIGGTSQIGFPNYRIPKDNVFTNLGSNGGTYTSLVIGADGLPVIAYVSLSEVRVLRCAKIDCSGIYTDSAVDSGALFLGSSIAIGIDGYPVVSYYRDPPGGPPGRGLFVAKCADATCSSLAAAPTLLDPAGQQSITSIAIGIDGLPVVSYRGGTSYNLMVAKCADTACTSQVASSPFTVDSGLNTGWISSIAIAIDGNPVIAYYDLTNLDLRVAKCNNAHCDPAVSAATITLVDSTGDVGRFNSIAIGVDGRPVIAYYDATNGNLKVVKCFAGACSPASGNGIVTIDGAIPANDVGLLPSLAIGLDNNPVISYYDFTALKPKVAKCGNINCSFGNSLTTIDPLIPDGGSYSSLAIGMDGLPIISYHYGSFVSGSGNLRIGHCGSERCIPYWTRR